MRRLSIVFLAAALVLPIGCRRKDQPAETSTHGNATDRSVDGTTGTGIPAHIANDSAASATALGTVAPTGTGGPTGFDAPKPIAVTGTEEVHAASTQTTGTLQSPNTTTVTVATPQGSTSTVHTSTGTTTTKH